MLQVVRQAADVVRSLDHLELVVEPQLSILLVRRRGWVATDYYAWSQRLLANGVAFVVPTTWNDEVVARFAVLNPTVSATDFEMLFDTMHNVVPHG